MTKKQIKAVVNRMDRLYPRHTKKGKAQRRSFFKRNGFKLEEL